MKERKKRNKILTKGKTGRKKVGGLFWREKKKEKKVSLGR